MLDLFALSRDQYTRFLLSVRDWMGKCGFSYEGIAFWVVGEEPSLCELAFAPTPAAELPQDACASFSCRYEECEKIFLSRFDALFPLAVGDETVRADLLGAWGGVREYVVALTSLPERAFAECVAGVQGLSHSQALSRFALLFDSETLDLAALVEESRRRCYA